MAAKQLMDITITSSLFFLLLLVPATGARYVSGGAIETQAGLIPMDGVSPVPTDAPGLLTGIPKELRKRDLPQSLCGLIDGIYDDAHFWSCLSSTSCVLKSSFYGACCEFLNTDLCFNTVTPTTCVDYGIFSISRSLGFYAVACTNSNTPYCFTITSSGLTPQFGCATTSYSRFHSFVPIAAYYSSAYSNTSPAKTSIATTPYTPSTTPITTTHTPTPTPITTTHTPTPTPIKSKLPTSAKAGIGSGVGVVTLAVITFLAFCFRRRRRNRAQVSPTTDGGAEPVMAQTNKDNTTLPDSAAPYFPPAPIYTNDNQHHTSVPPIPPNKLTSDTKFASNYPNSTVPPPASPLSPNHSRQTHQNPSPPWDYPPNSPISTLGLERSDLHHQDIPPTHSELDAGAQHHTGTPWNHSELGAGIGNQSLPWNPSELGAGVDDSGLPRNHSELGSGADHPRLSLNHTELPGAEDSRAHYPGPLNDNNNRSELGS